MRKVFVVLAVALFGYVGYMALIYKEKPYWCQYKDGYVLNTESKEFCNR